MSHWFHRNPLKSTAMANFEMKMLVIDTQAMKISSELRHWRSQVLELLTDPNNEVSRVEKALNEYLSLLQGLIVAPDGSNTESKLRYLQRFRWTHSVLGNPPSAQQDAIFELVCICQDFGIWLMKHAAMLAAKDETTMDSAKEVHTCLRRAAGVFSVIGETYVGRLLERPEPGTDLDPNVISAYINQCTAEAQEVTIARAIELKHAPSLISALACETLKLYTIAADALKELPPSKFEKWQKYLRLKAKFYQSYAYCYLGENLLAQEKCGEAIRALKESEACYAEAGKLCKEYSKAHGPGVSVKPEKHLFYRRLAPLVQRTLDKCERENGLIFHQRVAQECPELEMKATYGLASPEPFKLPDMNLLWTPTAYAAFDSPRVNPLDPANSKAASKAEGNLPPVPEKTIHQTTKDPSNASGCVMQ